MNKHYLALGEDMDALEKRLEEHNIPNHRYKYINAIHIQASDKKMLQNIIGEEYLLYEEREREQHTKP
ncbi:MAG: hypothetical protein ACMXYD_05120 [Candidatus Woesearchaeota archaeon]